jgi:CubicO group peptidase (beta-lactamase class C family)
MTALRLLILFLSVAVFAAPAEAQTGDDLIGLWGGRAGASPGLAGALTIERRGAVWNARIARIERSSRARNGEIRIRFPAGGSFRGKLRPDGRTLTGFWIQPPSAQFQPMATPLSFVAAGANAWRAAVRPLDERFDLYLDIFRGPDGALKAAFRNPEANFNGGAGQFSLSQAANALHFVAKRGSRERSVDAMLLSSPERIRIDWPGLGQTVELTRQSRREASGFFPRPASAPAYSYHPPETRPDGWKVARAGEVGIDEGALTTLVRTIAQSDPSAPDASLIQSLLIARHGRLVLEEYFFGFDAERPHDLRSAAKTFASVLMGTEMHRGVKIGPDMPIYAVLRSMGPFANPDPRKARITLADLMTHTSGLACDDNDDQSPGNEQTMQSQNRQPDWWKYTLDLPQLHDPGTLYAYCSANINLVGAALTAEGHMWLPAMFERDVAAPLQFGRWYWDLMPNGEGYLGGGAYLLPRDFLKIGQLYLDGGIWNGRRIIDTEWARSSPIPRIEVTPQSTGLTDEQFGNAYIRGADGLTWHQVTVTSGGRTYKGYSAGGNGGQLLLVFPELDLTAVVTGGNYGQGGIWLRWPQRIVGDNIIPAIRER